MMHILLLILKIIGIILLNLVVICLLILFFPIKYKGKVNNNKASFDGTIKAQWLFHVLSFKCEFDNESWNYALKLLGIKLMNRSSDDEDAESNSLEEYDDERYVMDRPNYLESIIDSENEQEAHPILVGVNTDSKDAQSSSNDSQEESKRSRTKQENKLKSFVDFLKLTAKKIKKAFKAIGENAKSGAEGAKNIYEKIVYYKKLLSSNVTKRAYKKGKIYVIKLIKHISPSKINGNLKLGFDEPHKTGQALGVAALIYGTFNIDATKFEILPDFENEVLEGKLSFKGKGLVCVILYYLAKFYFDRDIHRIIKKLK